MSWMGNSNGLHDNDFNSSDVECEDPVDRFTNTGWKNRDDLMHNAFGNRVVSTHQTTSDPGFPYRSVDPDEASGGRKESDSERNG
ncbi:hypothetical protein ACLOAV_006450 [Pseudogymnoascus australis]